MNAWATRRAAFLSAFLLAFVVGVAFPGVVLENCAGLAANLPEAFETTLEVFRHAARWWTGEQIPFWVLLGGLGENQPGSPRLDAAG